MFIGNVIVGILTLFQGNYDENVRFINHHNSHNHSFEVGENQFINKTYNSSCTLEFHNKIAIRIPKNTL